MNKSSKIVYYENGRFYDGLGNLIDIDLSGPEGVAGTQGIQGFSGNDGFGIQGIQGIQGSFGIQGIQGRSGVQGLQGLQGGGDQGVQGELGPPGPNSLIYQKGGSDNLGEISINSVLASANTILLNTTSKVGYSFTDQATGNALNWGYFLGTGDIIQVTSVDDPQIYGIYRVTSVSIIGTNQNTIAINVSMISANGVFNGNGLCIVSYSKSGQLGNPGSNSLIYQTGDPIVDYGKISMNTLNLINLVSQIIISTTSRLGFLTNNLSIDNSTSWCNSISIDDILMVNSVSDANNYGIFRVTGTSTIGGSPGPTGHCIINVSLINSNGIYDSESSDFWTVSYSKIGPQGIQGIQGIQGPQGIQGIQGIQGVQGLRGFQGINGPQNYKFFYQSSAPTTGVDHGYLWLNSGTNQLSVYVIDPVFTGWILVV